MRILFALTALALLTSCAQVQLTLPYQPQTTKEIDGRVQVKDFGYFPPQGIEQNEIPETAMGRIFITEPVGKFIADAVRKEFRQAGISAKGAKCTLEGEVNEFSLDSLGYSTDYATDIRYILHDPNNRVLLDDTYKVKFNASKFVEASVIMANINKAIGDNIAQLLSNDAFLSNVRNKCN